MDKTLYEDEPSYVFSRSDGAIMKLYRKKSDPFCCITLIDDVKADFTGYYSAQMAAGLIKKK